MRLNQAALSRLPMKSRFPLLSLSAILASCSFAFAEADWIIELWKSDDLNSWSILPLDAENIQDGRLRVQDGGDSRFYRIHLRTAEDVAKEKILAYIGAEGINVPVPTQQDYLDLAVGEVNPGDLAALNSHLLEFQGTPGELPAFIEAKIEMLSLRDPAAVAYATTVTLGESETERLSGFLLDLKAAGINPAWLVLGRSEFKARDGSTYRSVIGPNGTVVGTVVDAETGMVLDGSSQVIFPNPLQSATISDLYVFAHHGSDAASISAAASLVSAFVSTSDPGFDLAIGGAAGLGSWPDTAGAYLSYGVGEATVTRSSVFKQHLPGIKKLSGLVYSGSDPGAITQPRPGQAARTATMIVVKDLWTLNGTNTSATAYNNGATWTVGLRVSGTNGYAGEIDVLLAGSHPLTQDQRDVLHGSLLRHGLIETVKPMMLIAVGDSMTDGQAGGVPLISTRTAQLCHAIESGWQGCLYSNRAWSGQSIDVQEQLYEQAAARFDRFPDTVDKWIMFWGGYNATAPGEDDASQDALIDRYMAMSADAESRGVRSIHWSYLVGYDGVTAQTTEQLERYTRFVNEFRDRCEAAGYLFYDHRLTFSQGEFDGETRNPAFFVDSRHLSALGQQTLVADFISRFPGPPMPASECP